MNCFSIDQARKDNKAILGWFPRSKCWFTMVWTKDFGWESFGGEGSFYGERPTLWMELPNEPGEIK
jgi:hypothetical protein